MARSFGSLSAIRAMHVAITVEMRQAGPDRETFD